MVFLILTGVILVSKLFRAYGLYNVTGFVLLIVMAGVFQSSFELTGYITIRLEMRISYLILFQSSFELTGYITADDLIRQGMTFEVSKLFRAYRLYNCYIIGCISTRIWFQSSFELTGYITIITIFISSS